MVLVSLMLGGADLNWQALPCGQMFKGLPTGLTMVFLPRDAIYAVCRRAGGGFGGKSVRSLPPAAAVAVAANKVKRPVFYQLNRNEDFRMNGGQSSSQITMR